MIIVALSFERQSDMVVRLMEGQIVSEIVPFVANHEDQGAIQEIFGDQISRSLPVAEIPLGVLHGEP